MNASRERRPATVADLVPRLTEREARERTREAWQAMHRYYDAERDCGTAGNPEAHALYTYTQRIR